MKIGLLSICAMMFMLYGTDCRADRNVEDSETLREVKSESFKPVFAKNRKNARRNEERRNRKRQASVSSASEAEEVQQDSDSRRDDVGSFRDERSYADVVKGVKRPDENVQKEPTESEEQFYDAVDPEYNAWLEEKKRNERNSEKSGTNQPHWYRDKRSYADVVKGVKKPDENVQKEPESEQLIDKEITDSEDQGRSDRVRGAEEKRNKVVQPKGNRSKKAYEARRARQNRADQDEFSKKWKSANKSSNYRRK